MESSCEKETFKLPLSPKHWCIGPQAWRGWWMLTDSRAWQAAQRGAGLPLAPSLVQQTQGLPQSWQQQRCPTVLPGELQS